MALLLTPALFWLANPTFAIFHEDPEIRMLRLEDLDMEMKPMTRTSERQKRSTTSHTNVSCQEGYPPGLNYSGEENVTSSGRSCQVWASTSPHNHSYSDVGEHNFCRNPSGSQYGVWCYTMDPEKRTEPCNIPRCDATHNCQEGDPLGVSYAGMTNVTLSGRTCQAWSASQPHSHTYTFVGQHNYCRNPGGDASGGVGCFTTDPNKLFEYCYVPRCDATHNCQEGDQLGVSYAGTTNITVSGRTCRAWSDTKFTSVGEHNYCRNPLGLHPDGVFCFTTDPNKPLELCRVPNCDSMIKVIDFSADNDDKADSNGEYTSASINAGAMPLSFTICSAFTVEAWSSKSYESMIISLLDAKRTWAYVKMQKTSDEVYFLVYYGIDVQLHASTPFYFFPMKWLRFCVSLDSEKREVVLVVDGQMQARKVYTREEDPKKEMPANLSLLVGCNMGCEKEYTGRISDLNVFQSWLSVEKMVGLTKAGGKECAAPGDFLSWEEAEWTLHSKAKVIKVDRQWEGPCKRKPQVYVFPGFNFHHRCMDHCQKIAGGRSPPVRTEEEWESLKREVDLISPDRWMMPTMWLSATEGNSISSDRWPLTEIVNNETVPLESVETVWRDFYSGQRLDNWTKPYAFVGKDSTFGSEHNCMYSTTDGTWDKSWVEFGCSVYDLSCPCSYPAEPLITLRGFCRDKNGHSLIREHFTPKQEPNDPGNMILLGLKASRIEYNEKTSQWILTDANSNLTAVSRAPKDSYVLGKHEWTISNVYECSKGKPYTTMLKLTGCKEGEFTCDNGQCIKMEERCNQVPDCRDEEDEDGCQLIHL